MVGRNRKSDLQQFSKHLRFWAAVVLMEKIKRQMLCWFYTRLFYSKHKGKNCLRKASPRSGYKMAIWLIVEWTQHPCEILHIHKTINFKHQTIFKMDIDMAGRSSIWPFKAPSSPNMMSLTWSGWDINTIKAKTSARENKYQ